MISAPVQEIQAVDPGPYARILGVAFARLDPMVRQAHRAPLSAHGTVDVEHGCRWWTPILVAAMRLPAAGCAQPVRLQVAAAGHALSWMRQIGSSALHTTQWAAGSRLVEQSGPGKVTFDLAVEQGALLYTQRAMHVGGILVPRFLSPRVCASVSAEADAWRVAVEVCWRGTLVCRYAGMIWPA